ncbi:transmembrane protein 181-like isoform X2 [Styela clava]
MENPIELPSAAVIEFVRYNPRDLRGSISDYIYVGKAEKNYLSVGQQIASAVKSQVEKYSTDAERLQDNFIILPAFAIFLVMVLSVTKDARKCFGHSGSHDNGSCAKTQKTIQMRLYTLSKRQFVLVFVAFFTCFLLTVLVGLAGPRIISSTHMNTSNVKQENIATGPYTFMSPVMSTFNQQLWLLANIKVKNPSGATVSQDFTLGVMIFSISPDASGHEGTRTHNRTRTLHCSGSECDPLVVLHLGYLEYTRIRVQVNFYGIENLKYSVEDVFFEFKYYNPTFTQVEIWFRFVFLVISFLVTCMFAHTLRRFHMRDWTIEQKWISLLLPLLLLYNDPLFPLSFLINSWIPGFIDTIFQATFLCALLLFWLCVYHGIRAATDRRRFSTFYLPKLIICSLLWLAAVTLGSWQQYNELRDPTYQYKLDITNFTGMKVMFFTVGVAYILYLLFLLVRACSELRLKPYFNLRLRFLTLLTAFVLIISVAIIVLRFGATMLQDNFVADISTQYDNSAEFVCFYALLNFYMFTMAFVYSPSKTAQEVDDSTELISNQTLNITQDSPF